jgi:hypothetical protein
VADATHPDPRLQVGRFDLRPGAPRLSARAENFRCIGSPGAHAYRLANGMAAIEETALKKEQDELFI